MSQDPDLQSAIDRMAVAAHGFVNGNPGDFTEIWSRGDDITIFGGFGSGERGHDEIVERLAWASSRFHAGEVFYEPVTSGSSGDLGYAVGIERGWATLAGQEERGEMVLRVTHIFRRENNAWMLIHRHADALSSVTPPAAVLQNAPRNAGS